MELEVSLRDRSRSWPHHFSKRSYAYGLWVRLPADMCQDPKKIRDTGSPGSRIWDIEKFWIIFLYSRGILGILYPITVTFSWDPIYPGSQTEKMWMDPWDPGFRLVKFSWDLVDLGSCITILSLYLADPLHPIKFCFWFPMSLRCLNLSNEHMLRILNTSY